jgi:hypothetical protein
MRPQVSGRLLGLLMILIIAVQPCLGVAFAQRAPRQFADAEEAGAAMLAAGNEAATAIEIHARNVQRRKRLTAVLGGVVTAGAVLGGAAVVTGGGGVFTTAYGAGSSIVGVALVIGASATGIMLIEAELNSNVSAAVENAGHRRGWYLAKTVRFAPGAALESAQPVEDPSERAKQLGAVMAVATVDAPQMVEPAATAMVAALRESKSAEENLHTVTLVLRAGEQLGPDHPGVSACLDYLRGVLPKSLGRDASAEAEEAAEAYVRLRPAEASPLLSRVPELADQCELLASAADGAFRMGNQAQAAALLDRAVEKAAAIRGISARVRAEARIASYPVAAERRASLVSSAVALAQTTPRRLRTELVREVVQTVAPADMELALSVVAPDESPTLSVELARELVAVALRSRPSRGGIALVERMPRSADITADLNRLALLLAADSDPAIRAAGARAAVVALEVAPGVKNTEEHRRAVLEALSALALADPELAGRSVPERERRADPPLFAQAELRVGRILASQASVGPEPQAGQAATAMALIREGVSLGAESGRVRECPGYMAEAAAAIAAGYSVASAEAVAVVEGTSEGMLRDSLLIECGVAQALHGAPNAQGALTRSLARAQGIRDRDARETIRTRGIVGLSLLDRQVARDQLAGIPDERDRAWGLALMAALEEDRSGRECLDLLAAATAAAARIGDAEARADAIMWVIEAAASDPVAFRRACEQTGLPRQQPR